MHIHNQRSKCARCIDTRQSIDTSFPLRNYPIKRHNLSSLADHVPNPYATIEPLTVPAEKTEAPPTKLHYSSAYHHRNPAHTPAPSIVHPSSCFPRASSAPPCAPPARRSTDQRSRLDVWLPCRGLPSALPLDGRTNMLRRALRNLLLGKGVWRLGGGKGSFNGEGMGGPELRGESLESWV